MSKKTLTIAIDFDGVIHGYSNGWGDGTIYDPPVPGTKEALDAIKAAGHRIYIFTVRTNKIFHKDDKDQKKAIEDWMKQHELPFDKIWNFGKPMADVFIDDRAIGFRGKWEDTLAELQDFKVWNAE